jgi:hypothetical protein
MHSPVIESKDVNFLIERLERALLNRGYTNKYSNGNGNAPQEIFRDIRVCIRRALLSESECRTWNIIAVTKSKRIKPY